MFDKFDYSLIPDYTISALRDWVVNGIYPGGFLTAVLTNDLSRAVWAADGQNLRAIPQIAMFCYNRIPSGCQGSVDAVCDWPWRLQKYLDDGYDMEAEWKKISKMP